MMKRIHVTKTTLIGAVAGCVLVGIVGILIYQYVQLKDEVTKLRTTPKASQEAVKEENAKLIESVRSLISVPNDETPTIATVTDSEKLKNNSFFTNAKNGDKVLIYSSIKKAIIYRPSDHKIIEVGPISIGTPSAETKETVSFVLYNGTTTTGLTKKYEKTLKSVIKNATVVDRDNAKKTNYATSMLIDVKGTHTKEAESMAKALDMSVGTLPEGEVSPSNGEYLIIVGADKQGE